MIAFASAIIRDFFHMYELKQNNSGYNKQVSILQVNLLPTEYAWLVKELRHTPEIIQCVSLW